MWRVLTTFGPKVSTTQQPVPPPQDSLAEEISSIAAAEPKIAPRPNLAAHWPRTSTLKSTHRSSQQQQATQMPPSSEPKNFDTATNEEYKLVRLLGSGGFGEAYYARRRTPGTSKWTSVVLKRMRPSSSDKQQMRRLLLAKREAALMATLCHTHIVRFYRSFEEAGQIVIEMEHCDGGDLRAFLRARNGQLLPEKQIRHWFHQLAQAVSFIHDRNIIHRDIKSKNVFMAENGRCLKLGDFGSAKCLVDRRTNEVCLARTRVGTSSHHPPEFCRSKQRREYGAEVDTWAMGVLFFEMATLRMPFEAQTPAELSQKICSGVRDAEISSAIYSRSLRRLVDVLMSRDPDDRPLMREVLDDHYFVTYRRFCRRVKRHRSSNNKATSSQASSSVRNNKPRLTRNICQTQLHYYFDYNKCYRNNPNYQTIEPMAVMMGDRQTATSGVVSGSASNGNASPAPLFPPNNLVWRLNANQPTTCV